MFKVFAFGFETCIKTISSLISLCWLLTTFQSDAASAQRRLSLVSDKHVPACRFQSVMVWFTQPGVKVNDAYYCDISRLKQLLPDICQAAGDFVLLSSVSRMRNSTELLRHKTLDFTPHVWPPNRPNLDPVV